MAGKIITGVSLSLTLLTCVALGVQGSCGVQGACGSEEQKMTGRIQSMEMNETNRENNSDSDNDEYAAETQSQRKKQLKLRLSKMRPPKKSAPRRRSRTFPL